jgi:hypothetical protein
VGPIETDLAQLLADAAELAPPVRLPRHRGDGSETRILLRVPPTAVIEVESGPDGPRLRFPEGTRADRVEWLGPPGDRRVADVRGTTLLAGGAERFHVLRPDGGGGLHGVAWDRGDASAQEEATAQMSEWLAAGPLREVDPARRYAELRRFEGINRCADCHDHGVPESPRPGRGVHTFRATDASGFYTPSYVLRDDAPLERSRPEEANANDPFVEVSCDSGSPRWVVDGAGSRYECPGGEAPRGRYDVARALRAGEPHAQQVCRAREYLRDHLRGEDHAYFAEAFAACALPPM